MVSIGDRKVGVCLPLYGQNSSCPYAAIPTMLDSKGGTFVLIQALYYLFLHSLPQKSDNTNHQGHPSVISPSTKS